MERFNLGQHQFQITSQSADTRRLFNLGLNWCYGFNHEEGVACFLRALEFDPDCAMAHWGVTYASGPFYNFPWCDMCEEEASNTTRVCFEHIELARTLDSACSDLERRLIGAMRQRFQQPLVVSQDEFNRWDNDYASAMRQVWLHYSDHPDVSALFIEALITRTPWKLWDVRTGQPARGTDTLEALSVCERALGFAGKNDKPQHPAILHFHIHLTEMSSEPARAMQSAQKLASLCPDAGHLCHMPGHTYVLCGEYNRARIVSEKAIFADDRYLEYAGPHNFYTTARCHNIHLMMYTCMLMGRRAQATSAAKKLRATLCREVLDVDGKPFLAMTMEGYYSMLMHVYVRFGQWQEIISEPMPECSELYCVSTSMHHYAKTIAYATLKQFEKAREHSALFAKSLSLIPADRRFFNNSAQSILGVAEKMLEGEFLYHIGDYDQAFIALREAVKRDDILEYSEPWAWMHPPRHALGALLLEQGGYDEAELVYRTDLGLNDQLQRCAQHPNNVWALHGLVECLRQRSAQRELEIYQPLLLKAMALTDVAINASCLCRTQAG